MPQGNSWHNLLNNNDNKNDLIHLFVLFLKLDDVRMKLAYPVIVTEKESTWKMTKNYVHQMFSCNHEEADTRMVLHASLDDVDCVVCSKDTDVLLLLAFAYNKKSPSKHWFMKYETEKYADIKKVVEYLGNDVAEHLLQLHAITGCDTTSYFYRVGKISVFKKVLNNPSCMSMIENLGCLKELPERDIEDCTNFVQTVMYAGRQNEGYVATRIRLYKQQKKKTSLSLPPDPNSCKYAILRAHHQVFQWLRCGHQNIEFIPLKSNGWKVDEDGNVTPLWFTCAQLPNSVTSKRRGCNKKIVCYDGDLEEGCPISEPPRKRRTKRGTAWKDYCREVHEQRKSQF